MYLRELHVRYGVRRLEDAAWRSRLVRPQDVAATLVALIGAEVIEVAGVLCLSMRYDVIAYHELSRGTVDQTIIHPRDVFRATLLTNAVSVIVGHNHPSGDVTPSRDDLALTSRLAHAGTIVGIELVDHVIVSPTGAYYSFKEMACFRSLDSPSADRLPNRQPFAKEDACTFELRPTTREVRQENSPTRNCISTRGRSRVLS